MAGNVQTLQQLLLQNNCLESLVDIYKRNELLLDVEEIFHKWLASELPTGQRVRGLFLVLGSVKLEIQGPLADTDILLLVPSPASRSDCFTGFYQYLRSSFGNEVGWSRSIENTFIPVMKVRIQGIDLDMAVAQVPSSINLRSVDLMNDKILTDMDIQSVRSLNGYRDCVLIMNTLEGLGKLEEFQTALVALKFWAQRRGLYNNSVGYFSSMGLMVMLARIFLRFAEEEEHSAEDYLRKFFQEYSAWVWPRPVQIGYIEANDPDAPDLQVWNPLVYSFDKEDKMPIITPAYPQRNSAFTVTTSTRRVITEELRRGANIFRYKKPIETLFEPPTFFTSPEFSHYIILQTSSCSIFCQLEDHLDWAAVVRSQIRKLISDLEGVEHVLRLYPWPNAYPCQSSSCSSMLTKNLTSQWFIGLDREGGSGDGTDLSGLIKKFEENVFRYAEEHKISIRGRCVGGHLVSREEWQQSLPAGIGSGVSGFTALQERRKGFFV